MLRHLPAPLGLVLVFAGLSVITSSRTAVLLFAAVGVVLGLLVLVAAAHMRRSGRAADRTGAEERSDLRRFAARRRSSAPWESATYVLVAGGLIWLDGLTLGTILIAAGFGLLLIARLLVEPRTWAEVTRRLGDPQP
jgi:hypothetical protein